MPKKTTKTFLKEHPFCVFCGGDVVAETIEHCPPRSMFENRSWPQGYEFPACLKCNSSSSDDDLIIAFLARANPFDAVGNRDGKMAGLMKRINAQLPGFFDSMMPTNSEARRMNRAAGIRPAIGQTHQDVGGLLVPPRMDAAVRRLASKLSKAVYYKETGFSFPASGEIAMKWSTNFDVLLHGEFPLLSALHDLPGFVPKHTRANIVLNDQFSVKWSLSDDQRAFVLQAVFGKTFALVSFGCLDFGVVSGSIKELTEKFGPSGIDLV